MVRKPALLIVDDEPSILLTMRLVFQESGYRVTTAVSEAEAVQTFQMRGSFDAILSDMSMEHDQSGLEVENVKATVGTAVDQFIIKPIEVDDLKRVLGRLLALRSDRLAVRGGR